jgi:hypothetical protein
MHVSISAKATQRIIHCVLVFHAGLPSTEAASTRVNSFVLPESTKQGDVRSCYSSSRTLSLKCADAVYAFGGIAVNHCHTKVAVSQPLMHRVLVYAIPDRRNLLAVIQATTVTDSDWTVVPAKRALELPNGLGTSPSGSLLICDTMNNRLLVTSAFDEQEPVHTSTLVDADVPSRVATTAGWLAVLCLDGNIHTYGLVESLSGTRATLSRTMSCVSRPASVLALQCGVLSSASLTVYALIPGVQDSSVVFVSATDQKSTEFGEGVSAMHAPDRVSVCDAQPAATIASHGDIVTMCELRSCEDTGTGTAGTNWCLLCTQAEALASVSFVQLVREDEARARPL